MDDTLQLHHPALDVRLPPDVDQELFKYWKSPKCLIFKNFKIFNIRKVENIDQVRLPGDAEVLGKPPVPMGSRVVRCRARPG